MSSFSLHTKTILVTGASSGIGEQICVEIVSNGGKVIGVARREEKLLNLQSQLGKDNFTYIVADLAVEENIEKIAGKIEKINGFVYAAGITKLLPLKFVKKAIIEEVFQVNYVAMLLLTSALIKSKKLTKESSIVLISSVAQQIGAKSSVIYTGSKGAMTASARVMANELSSQKIRVNTIEPGMVRTKMADQVSDLISEEAAEIDESKYPLGYGEPVDVANAAVFLLSDASRWITGQSLTMDGGRYKLLD